MTSPSPSTVPTNRYPLHQGSVKSWIAHQGSGKRGIRGYRIPRPSLIFEKPSANHHLISRCNYQSIHSVQQGSTNAESKPRQVETSLDTGLQLYLRLDQLLVTTTGISGYYPRLLDCLSIVFLDSLTSRINGLRSHLKVIDGNILMAWRGKNTRSRIDNST